ncbi:hypothetical protein [Cryobacterium psychrophilum]|uniref:hypothetical protein n=1 Tax=Cryobacterium psychrophilum TaxID=41988 RepID=UPI003BAF1CB2
MWPRLKRRQPLTVAALAAVVAASVTPILTPGLPVLVAALVAVLVGWFNWFDRPADGAPVPELGS